MALTISALKYDSAGSQGKVHGRMTFDSDYRTGGMTLTAQSLGLFNVTDFQVEDSYGYSFSSVINSAKTSMQIIVYSGAAGTTGATSGGTPAGSIAAPTISSDSAGTPAGSVAAPTVSSDSAGTPSGSVAAPALTMDSYTPAGTVAAPTVSSDSAGTPAGSNAASAVSATYLPDYTPIVKPAIALTHNADPAGGLNASLLYVTEALTGAAENCGIFQSNNDGGVDVLGETADGSVYGAAGSARFWVAHSNTPTGVQVYVNEASSYRLECVSPTGDNVVVLMPMENGAGIGTAYVAVTIYHSATAATGKALYFDDNGTADAQLVFIAADTANHAIPAADIAVALGGATLTSAGQFGVAAAQVFTGGALGTHTHTAGAPAFTGTPAVLTGSNSAPAFTGSALGTHTHTAGAPAFTGSALGTHTHTAGAPAFTGSALATHTHTVGASGGGEVADHTNLSTLAVDFIAYGC